MALASPRFIPELQSLRGAAAVIVMVGHALQYYDNPAWFHTLSLIFNGRAAVVIFFVLSGYVLTRSLVRGDLNRAVIARFYVRRLFRIYPAIWAASALGMLYLCLLHWNVAVPGTGSGIQHQFRTDRMDALHIAASLAGCLAFILPQLWSIFVEIVASMIIPGLAYVARRGRAAFSAALLASLVVSFTVGPLTYYGIGLYFPDFLFGASICVFMPQITEALHRAKAYAGGLMVVISSLLLFTQYLPTSYYDPGAHLIESLLATTLIAMIACSDVRIPGLRSQAAVFLGDVSYSLYLLHYVVLCTFAKALFLCLPLSYAGDPVLLSVILAGLTVPTTILLSWLCYVAVEKPGIRAGDWVNAKLTNHWNAHPAVGAVNVSPMA